MEAEVDKDEGTFTNISLADDPGEAVIYFTALFLVSKNKTKQKNSPDFHNKISASDLQFNPKCSGLTLHRKISRLGIIPTSVCI